MWTPSSLVATLRAAGCVFAEDEARLLLGAAVTADELDALVRRRVAGEPLEHILGWVEFCGRRVGVEAGVFVPRRRTEFLVRQALELLAGSSRVVVDLCCGTGAVGAALAGALDGIELHAVDIDPAAVRCARRNLIDVQATVYEGDLYAPLPARLQRRVDVIVVNAPYVPSDEIALMPPEARLYEPLVALDGGTDGLAVQRRLIAAGPRWLAPGGWLLIETSAHQAEQTALAIESAGLTARQTRSAELSATVVIGTVPPTVDGGAADMQSE